jgi:hypothetical protein
VRALQFETGRDRPGPFIRVLPPQRFKPMQIELGDSNALRPRRRRYQRVGRWLEVGAGLPRQGRLVWAAAGLCAGMLGSASLSADEPPSQQTEVSGLEDSGLGDSGLDGAAAGVAGLEPGWTALFDGETLDGWVRRGGAARFEVRAGELVGITVVGQPNSFLCTEADYADFELELEFRLDDPRLNSGVQVRSQSLPEYQSGRVHGYQIEIDPSDRGWTGGIYDEGRRGWLQDLKNNPQARAAFMLGQWNHMRVRCEGDRIQSWVNGVATADLVDSLTSQGFIGLQVHSTRLSDPMEVRWRNIRLRRIDPDAS